MSKDCWSRVKNKKQFDETLEEIQKKPKQKTFVKSKVIKKTEYGHGTRYYY